MNTEMSRAELIKSAKVIVISRGLLVDIDTETGTRQALGLVPIPPALHRWQVYSQLYNTAELIFDETFSLILKARWNLLELEGLNSILMHPESSVIFASSTGYQLRSAKFSPLWGIPWEQLFNTPRPEGT